MRKTMLAFSVFFLVSSLLLAVDFPWEKKKEEQGIEVHVRPVEGSPVLEYKAVVVVDVPVERALALYEDHTRMTEWFHQSIESQLLNEKSPDEKILYLAVDLPWPVKDRDSVYRRERTQDPATHAVEYHISAAPGDLPEKPGRVRMPALRGLWRFTPRDGGHTEIYYQQHGDAGGYLPAWLINKLAVQIPYESLWKFRELLTEKSSD